MNLRERLRQIRLYRNRHREPLRQSDNLDWSLQHSVFLALQIVILFVWIWLKFHPPSPGWAIAILAAIAAAMSVHGYMRSWEKVLWMVLIGMFLWLELASISSDRVESAVKELEARQAQEQAFKTVRDKQDADFKLTAGSLNAAISGIQTTLGTANKTLLQTQPFAAIRFDRFEFAGSAPPTIESNKPYKFNYHYVNGGTLTASGMKILVKAYIGKADDQNSESQLTSRFEAEWKKEAQIRKPVLVPNFPSFGTIESTFGSVADDPRSTIYYLGRFEYTDRAGRWRTDFCGNFQRESPAQIDTNIFHTCSTFERFRYRVSESSSGR